MGFNIGRFLGGIAPAVGSFFGPIGTAVGLGVQAGFAEEPAAAQAATLGRATQPGPVSVSQPQARVSGGFQFLPTSVAPTFRTAGLGGAIIRQIPGAIAGATLPSLFGNGNGKSPISQILAQARAATGGPVTRNKIIEAAKACGLETAASTFGLDVRQVCLVIVKGRTRRRRGVSAADIRRTKRTIGFASKIRKDLKALAR